MAATKRARVERAMVLAMRVAINEEGKGDKEKDGVGNKGWRATKRARATAATAMATRVMGKRR